MLPLDPAVLSREITAGNEFRAKHTRRIAHLIRRYASNWYRDDQQTAPTPENHVFSWVHFHLPQLAYAAPSPQVQAVWKVEHRQMAEWMELGLGRWAESFPLATEIQLWVRDALLGFGVMKVGVEGNAGSGVDDGMQKGAVGSFEPFAVRIAPDSFGMDPRCSHWRNARLMWHEYWMDLDELQAIPGSDPDEVEQIRADYEESPAKSAEQAFAPGETAHRDQVRCVDLWIPEHGMVCTLAKLAESASHRFLRPPRKWRGASSGPFEVLGFVTVPDDPYPMSPLQPVMDQIEELQAHVTAAAEEAGSIKSFLAFEPGDEEAGNAAKKAKNGEVVPIPGISRDAVKAIEIGGTPPKRLEHIAVMRDRIDRILAISDAQRGVAQGKTATESQIVQANVDLRVEWMRSLVNVATGNVLSKVGWYQFYEEGYVQKVSVTDPVTGTTQDGTFFGGTSYPGQEEMDWEKDFVVTVEATSMQRTDDQMVQSRTLQLIQVVTQVAQMMPTLPYVNWRYLLDMLGQSFNQRELTDLLFNQEFLAQTMQTALAWGQMQPGPQPAPGQPGQPPQPQGVQVQSAGELGTPMQGGAMGKGPGLMRVQPGGVV